VDRDIIFTHHREVMKSVAWKLDSCGNLSLLFLLEVMIWHIVCKTLNVMTALIVCVIFKILLWSVFLCDLRDMLSLPEMCVQIGTNRR
jgi:hypothetical protein